MLNSQIKCFKGFNCLKKIFFLIDFIIVIFKVFNLLTKMKKIICLLFQHRRDFKTEGNIYQHRLLAKMIWKTLAYRITAKIIYRASLFIFICLRCFQVCPNVSLSVKNVHFGESQFFLEYFVFNYLRKPALKSHYTLVILFLTKWADPG